MITVIDNFIEDLIINNLEDFFENIPHYYGHSSHTDKSKKFYDTSLDDVLNPWLMTVEEKVKKVSHTKINILRKYINIQWPGLDGLLHNDDGDMTVLLMVTKTLSKGSGQFEIYEENDPQKLRTIDFVRNRLIMFPAKWGHRGMAPIEHYTPRITLAFKTEILK